MGNIKDCKKISNKKFLKLFPKLMPLKCPLTFSH